MSRYIRFIKLKHLIFLNGGSICKCNCRQLQRFQYTLHCNGLRPTYFSCKNCSVKLGENLQQLPEILACSGRGERRGRTQPPSRDGERPGERRSSSIDPHLSGRGGVARPPPAEGETVRGPRYVRSSEQSRHKSSKVNEFVANTPGLNSLLK
jgi:hypothetical protein